MGLIESLFKKKKVKRLNQRIAFMRQFFAEMARRERASRWINDVSLLDRVRTGANYEKAFTDREPLVSIIIPTYNRAQIVVERTIPSVLRQTHKNWELIIVGDQMAPELASQFAGIEDPRIRFINLKRRGLYPMEKAPLWYVAGTKPINFGLRIARGQWIAHLDDDDEFLPDHLERLLACARQHHAEWAHALVSFRDDHNREFSVVGGPEPELGKISRISSIYHAGLKTFRYNPLCWKYFCPGDWDLWNRFLTMGVRQVHLPAITSIHHGNDDRVTDCVGDPSALP